MLKKDMAELHKGMAASQAAEAELSRARQELEAARAEAGRCREQLQAVERDAESAKRRGERHKRECERLEKRVGALGWCPAWIAALLCAHCPRPAPEAGASVWAGVRHGTPALA